MTTIWRPIELARPFYGDGVLVAHDCGIDRGYLDRDWHKSDGTRLKGVTAWTDLPTVDTRIYTAAAAVAKVLSLSQTGSLIRAVVFENSVSDCNILFCRDEISEVRDAGGKQRFEGRVYMYTDEVLDTCEACLDALYLLGNYDERSEAVDIAREIQLGIAYMTPEPPDPKLAHVLDVRQRWHAPGLALHGYQQGDYCFTCPDCGEREMFAMKRGCTRCRKCATKLACEPT